MQNNPQCFQSRKRFRVLEDSVGVLLGGIHVVSLARNNPSLFLLKGLAGGDSYRAKPKNIPSVHHQSTLWPDKKLSIGPVSWTIQELQRNQACEVVEVQELSKLLEEHLRDIGSLNV
ncbi:hypothetical protein PGQ11_002779 [Apiospora arundinis]|uniref:Uncharacterized protein n=1 Tax=Apiospora arundinis TaxID=335852 RepID=A0ABR2J3N8_9PEZI